MSLIQNFKTSSPPAANRSGELRSELARKIAHLMGSSEIRTAEIPCISLHRRTAPTDPCPATYEPGVFVIPQGKKEVQLGPNTFIYDESRFCSHP